MEGHATTGENTNLVATQAYFITCVSNRRAVCADHVLDASLPWSIFLHQFGNENTQPCDNKVTVHMSTLSPESTNESINYEVLRTENALYVLISLLPALPTSIPYLSRLEGSQESSFTCHRPKLACQP